MHNSVLGDFLIEHGSRCERLQKKLKWSFQQRWRESFAAAVKEQTGRWSQTDVADWEVFAAGLVICVKNTKADILYEQVGVDDFTVISSNHHMASYRCQRQRPPEADELLDLLALHPDVFDLYVSACDLEWTFVLTHECGFERYFARRVWQQWSAIGELY